MFGKMENKKILITINDLKDINRLKKLGITNYVYPLKDFCVGYPNTFLISDIPNDGYVLVNRILDNKGILELENIIKNGLKVKGIIFDDLGIIPFIKDLGLEKILYLSHFNTNYESINIYLEYVDSVVVATDITKKEIEAIASRLPNKLTLFVLGYVGVMYTRRKLLDNYSKYHKLDYENDLVVQNTGHKFRIVESSYGTYFYHDTCFAGLDLLKLPAKYYFINSVFLSIGDIEKLLNGQSDLVTDRGFLETETIYKLKGE